ncbi:MAG TPA: non-ribosomal peptide synthetase, partial [Acidobacteria bacterium]|nr:non-ribosomal peptide synthetase [Acidobacteriota bacterium]
ANRLAHHLRSLGVGPEVRVGLCIPRSLEMLVGLWGILKAGGAYVPLDPRHPRERLAWVIGDARPHLVVTVAGLAAGLEPVHGRLVCLDGDEGAGAADESPRSGVAADGLAYVLYTSGSTGFPKGVMVPHRGLVNYLAWCCREYAVADGAGAPVGSPLGFDLTVTSLFAPLLAGRTVELLEEPDGPEGLAGALRHRTGLSLVKVTPLHLELLARSLPGEEAAGRTHAFVIGGEALNAETLAFWRSHARGTRLINEYGPTETVVGCCFYEVPAGFPHEGPVPIGRPVANTRLYVVDPWLHPVIDGVPGELLIAGDGVTRGYLGRPDLTAERFVPDPWSGMPGARLYRSGDLTRRGADGNLEFLGRIDHQLKIRGFRIEPAEIEAAFLRHPEIREAVVTAGAGGDGHKHLVAYFVPRRQPAPPAAELRSFLGRELPEHMVPGVLIPLPALPLNANGKLDRAALAAIPETDRLRSEQPFVAPRTAAEKILAAIWCEILRVEEVGVHDNFFDLGGDSILSIQIVSRANQAGIPLAPRDLFRHQTIAALAAVEGAAKLAAEQGEVVGELPLVPIQHRFFAAEPAAPHHFNQAVLLGLRRPVPWATLEAAMRRLAGHHDALRLRFQGAARQWRQVCAASGQTPPGTRLDLSALPPARRGAEVERAAAAMQGGLSLGGPLGRWGYFDVGPGDFPRLLLIFHHLVIDGVSWRILLQDLEALCDPQEPQAALPPKTTSFKTWAEGLVERSRSAPPQDGLRFWLAEEGREAMPLPVDFVAGPNSVASADSWRMTLGEEETRLLLQAVPRVYQARIDDVLLTALAQVCASWTGCPSLWVDLEGHGRDALPDVDVSRTVGWFTAVYPVRLELAGGMEPAAALLSIQEQLRALPDRGTSHGLLLFLHNDEGIRRRLDALPRPQVVFNYLGQFDQILGESSLFIPVGESAGATRAPEQERWHLLEVTGLVVGGCLQITWTYSRNRHSKKTVEGLGQAYMAAVRSLLDRCRQGAAPLLDLPAACEGEDLERALENVEFEV